MHDPHQLLLALKTRLVGLILAAMAAELLADGLVKLFPVLASHVGR